MTKTFILILFLKSGYAGGVTQIEYSSRKSCEDAKEQLVAVAEERWMLGIFATCVEKE